MLDEQQLIRAIHANENWLIPAMALAKWLRNVGENRRATALERCVFCDFPPRDTGDDLIRTRLWLKSRLSSTPRQVIVSLAADCAEHVLNMFEHKFPNDDRPRKAIEWTRRTASMFEPDINGVAGKAHFAAGYVIETFDLLEHEYACAFHAAESAANAAEAAGSKTRSDAVDKYIFAAEEASAAAGDLNDSAREERWQEGNLLLQLYFGPNNWLIREHRRMLGIKS